MFNRSPITTKTSVALTTIDNFRLPTCDICYYSLNYSPLKNTCKLLTSYHWTKYCKPQLLIFLVFAKGIFLYIVHFFSLHYIACDITTNGQFKILTMTKDTADSLSIGKTCTKQPVFSVFVWDKEWKTLHSTAASSLFSYSQRQGDNKVYQTRLLINCVTKLPTI